MTTPCTQETKIALLAKTNSDMVDRVKKIETDVSSLKEDFWQMKDLLGTIKLSMQKDNSDIKQIITESFSDIRINFEKEKEKSIKDINNTINEKDVEYKKVFASKWYETVLKWIWISAWLTVLGLVINFLAKWIWNML